MGNRILLADDSITIQKVVNLTFTDEGIEVIAVSNGDMAERRLADVQPDLVLADIFMPGKNGYELCEAIKTSPQFSHIPVVLLVGAFEPFDQSEARRVKADAHLTKPFESRTLVETVRRLISASSQPHSGPLPALPVPDARHAPDEPVVPLTPVMAEPRSTIPMMRPFNLDLPAMAIDTAPPAAPSTLSPATPFNYNFGSNEDPLAIPMEVQVAEAPAPGDTAFAAQGNALRRTDDLSFGDSQPPFERLGLDDFFAEPGAVDSTPDFAASPSAQTGQAESSQESGFAVPSTFGYATEEILLDFDQPSPVLPRVTPEPFAFDIDEREEVSVDATGMQPEDSSVQMAVADKVLKTTVLETPQPTGPVESAINTNPLEMPASQTPGEAHETAFATGLEALDESALFNGDDPLGDVLYEGLPEAAAPEAMAAPSAPAESPDDRFTMAAPVAETGVEAISGEAPAPAEAAASIESPVDYEVEFPAAPMAATSLSEPAVAESIFSMETPPVEPAMASETGFGFTTASEENEPVDRSPQATEVKFTTASMWTDEEARFAAIDIEATSVEEPTEAGVSQTEITPAESFVFDEQASAYITQPNMRVEAAAPVEAVEPQVESVFEPVTMPADLPVSEEPTAMAPPPQEAPATAAASAVELSPALIDEIVRRVVAQLSESVVREIAWEVVPDCVERIIRDMTAQEVSRR